MTNFAEYFELALARNHIMSLRRKSGLPSGTGCEAAATSTITGSKNYPLGRITRIADMCNIPFGYRLAADRKHLEPEPAEQALIAEIHTLRLRRRTLREIATALNLQLHRTRRGSPWRHQHVARVIQRDSRFVGALSE